MLTSVFFVNDFAIGLAQNSIDRSYWNSVNLSDISSASFICELIPVRDGALDINDVLNKSETQDITNFVCTP